MSTKRIAKVTRELRKELYEKPILRLVEWLGLEEPILRLVDWLDVQLRRFPRLYGWLSR